MPELPEVEVMTGRVNAWSAGFVIRKAEVLRQNGKYQVDGIEGCGVLAVFRRGKQMIFQLTGDKVLIAHNAMSGYWDTSDDPWTFNYVEGKRTAADKDVRVQFTLDSGRVLRFHDSRLFGNMHMGTWLDAVKLSNELGPEAIATKRMFPLAPVLNPLDLAVNCKTKKAIKQVLLEQELLAGVGNIYAAESLWVSQIHPLTPANQLNTNELCGLTEAIQGVLKSALGRNLAYDGLMVYRRKNCSVCSTEIKSVEVAKRATYFCPSCQKEKA